VARARPDAKDAAVIADQARMRPRDPAAICTHYVTVTQRWQLSRMLCARRTDLACDRTRAINRLQATSYGPSFATKPFTSQSNSKPLDKAIETRSDEFLVQPGSAERTTRVAYGS
jgi:hypothetical protein